MEPHTTVIDTRELAELLADASADVIVCDCRFDLKDPDAGERAYQAGHIPGAVYLHLDRDLAGGKTGSNGRHPLPDRQAFAERLASSGVNRSTLLVAYDAGNSMYAARLWWMARWAGLASATVLDGGLAAWTADGRPLTNEGAPARPRGDFAAGARALPTLSYEEVAASVSAGERLIVDARSPDRFRGENETLDRVGGHIPGARNRFFGDNLDPNGRFKPGDVLRREFDSVLAGADPRAVVAQCGSGVTACHNLLAMEIAGLRGAALYPGSWSEWSARAPEEQIATGSA